MLPMSTIPTKRSKNDLNPNSLKKVKILIVIVLDLQNRCWTGFMSKVFIGFEQGENLIPSSPNFI